MVDWKGRTEGSRLLLFGFSQFEVGMFRICRKEIAKLEARKAEPARLQRAQEAKASSVFVWISLAFSFLGELKGYFFL